MPIHENGCNPPQTLKYQFPNENNVLIFNDEPQCLEKCNNSGTKDMSYMVKQNLRRNSKGLASKLHIKIK